MYFATAIILIFIQFSVNSLANVPLSGSPEKKFSNLSPWADNPKDVIVTEVGPSAATFLSVFAEAVKASDILIQIFDMSQVSVQEYSQFVYKYSLLSQQNWGSKHPEIASEFAARPVAQNFYNFPLESLIRITANIMIRFLHSENILKEQNAESLALAYIKSFENSAKRCNNEFQQTANLKQTNCQYETLGKGFTNFVNSIVRMTPAKAWNLAIYFGNSFTLESIEHGPGNY